MGRFLAQRGELAEEDYNRRARSATMSLSPLSPAKPGERGRAPTVREGCFIFLALPLPCHVHPLLDVSSPVDQTGQTVPTARKRDRPCLASVVCSRFCPFPSPPSARTTLSSHPSAGTPTRP